MTQSARPYSRRSFLALTLDFGLYGFGMSFSSVVTILPAFVARLSGSNLLIGLITTIAVLGFNVPQILVTNYVEKMRTKKKFIMLYTLGERVPWLFLAVLTVLLSSSGSSVLLFIFFLMYAVANISAGVVATAWFDLVAKVVPEGKRGLYFGASNFVSTVLGVVGGAAAGLLIESLDFLVGYAACFLITFILTMASYAALSTVEEPESVVNNKEQNLHQYLNSLPDILRADSAFSKYLLATIVAGIATMAPAFLAAHALKIAGTGEQVLGLYTAVYFASQVLSNFIWAHLGDTKGHVAVVMLGGLLGALSSIVAILSTSAVGFAVSFALMGAYMSGFMVSWWSAVMEFGTEERRPTYLALAGALRALPASLAPLVGGIIADTAGDTWIFGIATVAYLVSTAMVFSVLGARGSKRTTAEAGEFGLRRTVLVLETPRP